jgi:ribosomal protein S27E
LIKEEVVALKKKGTPEKILEVAGTEESSRILFQNADKQTGGQRCSFCGTPLAEKTETTTTVVGGQAFPIVGGQMNVVCPTCGKIERLKG